MRELPWSIARGFLMGAADVVPGVSGGTIALVVGIYERLLESIRSGSSALGSVLRLDWRRALAWAAKVEWGFILPLLAGIALAILTLAGLIESQLEENPVQLAALFLGLVAGSVVVAWRMLRRRDPARLLIMLATAVAVFVLLGVRRGTSEDAVAQLDDAALWVFFASGAVAICAMILPGISGSFILVILGMYGPVLAAVNDRDLLPVAAVGLGAVVGLALFSQLLHWALQHHHDSVLAALIGLMAGSVRVVWPWPDGVDSTALGAPDEAVLVSAVLAAVGLVAVIAIHALSERVDRSTGHSVEPV